MAISKEKKLKFLKYVLDCLPDYLGLTYKYMFGEYALYLEEDKVICWVCDAKLFLKQTISGENFMKTHNIEIKYDHPYPGSKPAFFVSDLLEKPEILGKLILKSAPEIEPIKKKKNL